MHERQMARLFGLSLVGVFTLCLILNAFAS
jgi:hypothetical protein